MKIRGQFSWVLFLLVLLWGRACFPPDALGSPAQESPASASHLTVGVLRFQMQAIESGSLRLPGLCLTSLSPSGHLRGPKVALIKFKIIVLTFSVNRSSDVDLRRSEHRELNLYLKFSIYSREVLYVCYVVILAFVCKEFTPRARTRLLQWRQAEHGTSPWTDGMAGRGTALTRKRHYFKVTLGLLRGETWQNSKA